MDRRHEVGGEERPDRLPDGIRRRHPGDPEAMRDLRRNGRLARAGRTAHEHDDRQVELLQVAVAPELADRVAAVRLAEHGDRELLEALELDALRTAFDELRVDAARELVGAHCGDADRDQRARHQTLRVRLVRAPERQRLRIARLAHTLAATCANAASCSSSAGETTSFAARTTSTPCAAAASATTSIAAAFSSTRKTSASACRRSSRKSSRLAR